MIVKCVDITTPRSDYVAGSPDGLTIGNEYVVAEVLESQYSIINDEMKMARYSQVRFEVVEDNHVLPLRRNFNTLTTPLRSKIKELNKINEQINRQIEELKKVRGS